MRSREEKEQERVEAERKKREEGKIGEGKGRTLGEKTRRDLMYVPPHLSAPALTFRRWDPSYTRLTKPRSNEAKRREAIMSHNQFKSDPWATIRLHAGNSLATKEVPGGQGKKQTKKLQKSAAKKAGGEMDLDD